jgi:mono/diheme cytochrome c family protein
MIGKLFLRPLAPLALAALLCGCGQSNTGDPVVQPVTGPNSFLLFPNPQKQADGSLQTDTLAYAQAYYAAIDVDPSNPRDTLANWKKANHFGEAGGTEVTAVFGDVRDLGYGRRMTARQNVDGTIAVMVENYLAYSIADYTYSSVNLEAAVARDSRWHVSTNAIEFSPRLGAPSPTNVSFAKFYTFSPVTGERLLTASLDGRGDKAMPGICISCHGGRADPLTPAAGSPTGQPLFPLVGYSVSQARGDVQAHLQMLNVDSFDFSPAPGFTRADQEDELKAINKMVLCTYPLSGPVMGTEDNCRRAAQFGEWGGTAAAVIKKAYGGDTLPNPRFLDDFLPAAWSNVGQTALYKNVVAPVCRTCHILRGTNAMDEIDFMSYCPENGSTGTCDAALPGFNFKGYADRIKAHVIDRGNMPLAKIVFQRFWSTNQADTLATFLQANQSQPVRDAAGAVLMPGRPVADPGPDRTTTSPATLSGANSLFASTYSWSMVSGPGTLTKANTATATLTAPATSTNVVQLVVGDGIIQSAPARVMVTVPAVVGPGSPVAIAPSAIRFANIKAILQDGLTTCTGCHFPGGGPPIFYTDIDRNGDSLVNSTDDAWFYAEVRGRINFTDIAASPLLRKPRGFHHGGSLVLNFTDATVCNAVGSGVFPECQPYATLGAYYSSRFNILLNWILNGAPQ